MPQDLDPTELTTLIRNANAAWIPGRTLLTDMPLERQQAYVGYTPGPGEQSLEQRVQASSAELKRGTAATAGTASSWDWRNVGGKNFITSIKDQGLCASAPAAFAATATVEAMVRIQRNNPNLTVDLSEAQLLFCIAPGAGGSCTNGWWVGPALDGFKNPGIADEACFPYAGQGQQACNLCSDWQNRVTKITGWHTITGVTNMKAWISTKGPLATVLMMYSDFFAYTHGVYRHVSGSAVGGHIVSVVGYDDAGGFWICKNSWTTAWGESGFFCIAYGECGIDSTMWAVEGILETGWLNNTAVIGLWSIDQDRNAWAYLAGYGWRRIAADNDNIFVDLLRLLVAAKEGGRPINVYQDNAVIKQAYVL
jgi:C1A family cysteine protease